MSPDSAASQTTESAHLQARLAHRGRRPYLFAGVLLVIALLAGIVIGAGGAVIFFERRGRPKPPSPEEVGRKLAKDVGGFVDLNETEREQLRVAIVARMQKVADIRKQSWDDIQEQFDALSYETEDIIGSERYQKWEAERDRRQMEKRGKPWRQRRPREALRDHH